MEKPEIILNLWYVCDDMGIIYSLRARAYIAIGPDKDKMALLQLSAEIDYLIARAFPIPKKYYVEGKSIYHRSGLSLPGMPVALFEEAIQTLQNELPSQTPYDIPQKPMICLTPLLGDDYGNIEPVITDRE